MDEIFMWLCRLIKPTIYCLENSCFLLVRQFINLSKNYNQSHSIFHTASLVRLYWQALVGWVDFLLFPDGIRICTFGYMRENCHRMEWYKLGSVHRHSSYVDRMSNFGQISVGMTIVSRYGMFTVWISSDCISCRTFRMDMWVCK